MNAKLNVCKSAPAVALAVAVLFVSSNSATAQIVVPDPIDSAPPPAAIAPKNANPADAPGNPAAANANVNTNTGPFHFRVVDSFTGAPIEGVKIHTWIKGVLPTDTTGSSSWAMPKANLTTGDFTSLITITKDGYVAKTIMWSKSHGDSLSDVPADYTAKMEKAITIGGILKTAEGQPLANAIIRFSGVNPASPTERERTLVAPNFHNERTDDEGRWQCNHVPPDFTNFTFRVAQPGMMIVVFGVEGSTAGGPDVVRLPAADFLASKATITVGHGISLAGLIVDYNGKPVPNVVITRNHEWRNSGAVLQTDDTGHFNIPNLLPGDMTLTMQAKGLEPQTVAVAVTNDLPELKVSLKPGRVLKGRILDDAGQPVVGASVQMDRVNLEPLEFDWSTTTDGDGRFVWDSAPAGEHPYLITADGYNLRSEPALVADQPERTITLRKTNGKTDVDGIVTDATTHAPIDNFTITVNATTDKGTAKFDKEVSSIAGDYLVEINQKVTTFTLEFRRPGYLPTTTDLISPGDGDQRQDIQLEKGVPTEIAGQLTIPGYDHKINWQAGQTIALTATVPDPVMPNFDDEAAKARWMNQFLHTTEGKAWQRAQRSFPAVAEADGSFDFQDVPPGQYQFRVQLREAPELGGGKLAAFTTNITVKDVPDKSELLAGGDAPRLNMGVLKLQQTLALRVGDMAPTFETATTDGKPLKLTDFRGRFVLVDFWATWCGPCVAEMPNLKATYDKHAKDNRFAMMSLSVDAQAAQPIDFAKKNDIHWIQGFLGEWQKSPVPDMYGVEGIPAIFLIGPDGRIVARDLRGPEIDAAITAALAPHGIN